MCIIDRIVILLALFCPPKSFVHLWQPREVQTALVETVNKVGAILIEVILAPGIKVGLILF